VRCANAAGAVAKSLPGPFPLTAWICLLSQLMDGLADSLGASHPRFAEAVNAVRLGHLHLMADMTTPGGEAILIADVVSSLTCPELATAGDDELSDLLAQARDMNPAALATNLASDAKLISTFHSPRWLKPWVWNLGLRLYLVHAVSLTERG
jgi:hypothetical protein